MLTPLAFLDEVHDAETQIYDGREMALAEAKAILIMSINHALTHHQNTTSPGCAVPTAKLQ